MSSLPPSIPNSPQDAQSVALQKVVGTVQVDKTPVDEMKAYFTTGQTTTYIMPNGTKIVFVPGAVPGVPLPAFVTRIKGYQAQLDMEIAQGHPIIHTIEEYKTVTAEQLDPHDAIKKKAIADFIASQEFKKFTLEQKGVGTPEDSKTVQGVKLEGIANSETVSEGASGSDSVPGASLASKLAALSAPKV